LLLAVFVVVAAGPLAVAVVELLMMLRIFFLCCAVFSLVACGAKVEKREVKRYVLGLKQGDEAFKPLLRQMIEDYNYNLGYQALDYAHSMDSANSPVLITKGLETRDGKVGWGQWFAETKRKGSVIHLPGQTSSVTTTYSLQVEFDEDFIKSNMEKSNPGELHVEIRKLFAHEVGHGFQMDHVPTSKDVMYFDISGEKDFNTYWLQVREFFGLE
jgi:hypothetical protein